jgi:hypothetical protein
VVPGTTPEGNIDGAALEIWVKEARKKAHAVGRGPIADQKIGEAMSASPAGEDSVWPALAVRELVETVRSAEIELGLLVGLKNRRGVTGRLPRDGGAQERALAKRYGDWADATAFDWIRTSAVLRKITEDLERDANGTMSRRSASIGNRRLPGSAPAAMCRSMDRDAGLQIPCFTGAVRKRGCHH